MSVGRTGPATRVYQDWRTRRSEALRGLPTHRKVRETAASPGRQPVESLGEELMHCNEKRHEGSGCGLGWKRGGARRVRPKNCQVHICQVPGTSYLFDQRTSISQSDSEGDSRQGCHRLCTAVRAVLWTADLRSRQIRDFKAAPSSGLHTCCMGSKHLSLSGLIHTHNIRAIYAAGMVFRLIDKYIPKPKEVFYSFEARISIVLPLRRTRIVRMFMCTTIDAIGELAKGQKGKRFGGSKSGCVVHLPPFQHFRELKHGLIVNLPWQKRWDIDSEFYF